MNIDFILTESERITNYKIPYFKQINFNGNVTNPPLNGRGKRRKNFIVKSKIKIQKSKTKPLVLTKFIETNDD